MYAGRHTLSPIELTYSERSDRPIVSRYRHPASITSASTLASDSPMISISELRMLPVPSRLRPLVPEHRAQVEQSDRLGQVLHSVLQIGAARRSGALGTQGQHVPATVLERVGLLLDDVGRGPHAALEQRRVLKDRCVEALEPGPGRNLFGRGSYEPPILLVFGKDVDRAPGGLELQWDSPG